MSLSDVVKLPLLLQKIDESGCSTLEQVKQMCLSLLTKELESSKTEPEVNGNHNAQEDVQKKKIKQSLSWEIESSFTSGVRSFDRLFIYGISPMKITEICGESGSGKSQLCMQMAVTIQLPRAMGGSDGECIYIDTEGSFRPKRVLEIAKKYNLENPLKGIRVFRVLDHIELVAILMQLHEVLRECTKVKLVIIDSIVFHLRLNVLNARARNELLNYIGLEMIKVAKNFVVSVVVTNHVTTDFKSGVWTPSLGNEWGNWCANRLYLYRKREFRYGYLHKSFENLDDAKPVQFCIKDEGLLDPDEEEMKLAAKSNATTEMQSSQDDTGYSLDAQDEMEFLAIEREFQQSMQKEEQQGDVEGLEKRELSQVEDGPAFKRLKHSDSYLDTSEEQGIGDDSVSHDPPDTPNERLEATDALMSSQPAQDQPSVNTSNIPHQTKEETDIYLATSKEPSPQQNNAAKDSYWGSDSEEELDLDFLQNIQSYF